MIGVERTLPPTKPVGWLSDEIVPERKIRRGRCWSKISCLPVSTPPQLGPPALLPSSGEGKIKSGGDSWLNCSDGFLIRISSTAATLRGYHVLLDVNAEMLTENYISRSGVALPLSAIAWLALCMRVHAVSFKRAVERPSPSPSWGRTGSDSALSMCARLFCTSMQRLVD